MRSPLPGFSCAAVLLCFMLVFSATSLTAEAVTVSAGWSRADVGLHNKGDGIYLGVGHSLPLPNPVFETVYSLEYVQKKGSHPTSFFDPIGGFTVEDAEVTLHVVQPSLFLGVRIPDLPVAPRLYVGGSLGLKVKESWSDFPGVPDRAYGYKETDVIAHVGAAVGLGPVSLDLRWSQSLVGQLLFDPQQLPLSGVNSPQGESSQRTAAKADDALAGVGVPEEGHKTSVLQFGVTYGF